MAKILIADDESDIVKVLQYRLEKNGYEVVIAANGNDAWDRINETQFDLILLDYFMPSLKGDEVCQRLRETENYKNIPVIVMTAFSNKPEDFFKDQGATEVIYKPIDDSILLEKISKLLPA